MLNSNQPLATDYTVVFLLDDGVSASYIDVRISAFSKQEAINLVKNDVEKKFKHLTISGTCVTPTALFAA